MMHRNSMASVPTAPAVYAMYGGRGHSRYVAYVGIAENLRQRLSQHLIRRSSSVTAGTAAVGLNVAYITEIRWWNHSTFEKRVVLQAAELIAFLVLDPALRSRGDIHENARQLAATEDVQTAFRPLFLGEASGRLLIPTLSDALERIDALERRLASIEHRLDDSSP